MKKLKWVPYRQYELEQLADWFRQQGEQGLALKQLYPVWMGCIAEFERRDTISRYQVRYQPNRYDFTDTVYWGSLCVTTVQEETAPTFCPEDYRAATKHTVRFGWIGIVALLLLLCSQAATLIGVLPVDTAGHEMAFMVLTALSTAITALLIWQSGTEWLRCKELYQTGVSAIRVYRNSTLAIVAGAAFLAGYFINLIIINS